MAALAFLKSQGFSILATDWRCRAGQIDIVGEEDGTLVVIEVKARRTIINGLPQESVDGRKQHKLRMLLETYRATTKRQQQPCRIDVLALMLDERMLVSNCEHIRDAVQDM
jgi:putative endonuclease